MKNDKTDPIVQEVHRARAQISQENGDDLHTIAEHFRAMEKKLGDRIIFSSPRVPQIFAPVRASSPKNSS